MLGFLELRHSAVKSFSVLHVFRLYHRLLVWSMDNEGIAEHIASVVRFIEKRHGVGRPLNPSALVRAVRLRCLGIRGDGTDAELIDAALQRCMPKSSFIAGDRAWAGRQAERNVICWALRWQCLTIGDDCLSEHPLSTAMKY